MRLLELDSFKKVVYNPCFKPFTSGISPFSDRIGVDVGLRGAIS